MNKIAFLKVLIGIITFLIFLTLGGIIYGLVNYKTTPKLLSNKNRTAPVQNTAGTPREIFLDLKDKERIQDSHACADMLCIRVVSDFDGERIIIVDPAELQIKAVIFDARKKAEK